MCPLRYFNSHDLLDSLNIGETVNKAADTTYSFSYEGIFSKFAFFYELFEPPMNIPNRWENINNGFILEHKVKVDRFRKHRVLGAERNDYLF
jgi:hypothetical protein